MLGKNFFACVRDIKAGIDTESGRSRRPTAARSGPYPPLGASKEMDEPEGIQQRRLDGNAVGTFNTPLAVPSAEPEVGEHKASM